MSPYIFKRGDTYYVKTQGAKRVERTLRTSDRALAVVRAAPFIQAHQRELAARAPRVVSEWQRRFEPRLAPYAGDREGEQIVAGDRDLSIYDAAGTLLRTEPNGGPAYSIVGNARTSALEEFTAFDAAYDAGTMLPVSESRAVVTSPDDAILTSYLDLRNVIGYPRREALATWALFRQLTNGKPFRSCTWEDGRALVAHYTAQGLKVASIHKRLVRLNAAVNFAKRTGKLPRDFANPFAAVVAKEGDDSTERVALDDADLKACLNATDADGVKFWDKLAVADQLLFRTLCTTGMRLNEAFQINSEKTLKGIRFCEVVSRKGREGKKPLLRRVPFPAHLLPHLPAKIDAPLFSGTTNDASHRLNAFLRDCGITDEAKTLHSLRHRAIGLLDEAECPDNVSRRLFGHAQDEHEKYSKVIVVLKKWIDRIDGI